MKRTSSYRQWFIVAALVLLLMGAESVAMHRVYATRVQGTADFFTRWYGATQLMLHHRNPYDRAIDLEMQQLMFGRLSRPDEDQVNFAYPLYTVYLFWPLAFVPYAWAQAIWMVVLQFALLGGTTLLFGLARWRVPPWMFVVTLFWGLFFYSSTRAIMLGQFSIIVFLCLTVSLWGLVKGHNRLAGAVLSLTTVKPQMVFLIIPFMLLWAWRQKRWSFIIAFGLSMALLLASSIAWVPDWPLRFYNNLSAYSGYVGFGSPLENLTARLAPGPDRWLNPVITVALAGLLVWLWGLALTRQPERFLWTVNWTLLVSNLIVTRSATTNHVTLYLAIFIIFKRLALSKWGLRGVVILQLAGFVSLWVLFLTTIDTSRGDNFEAVFMHGLLPALLIVYSLLDWRGLKTLTPTISPPPPDYEPSLS
ncbi:MAG: glycosyltransferase family 87 protein [Anaerolineae bacterium]